MKKTLFRWILAAYYIATGLNHFRVPDLYISMIPLWIPWPSTLNLVAGIWKIVGVTCILAPRLRIASGWGLIGFIVAVFPANLHVALMGHMPGSSFPPLFLWLRLPLQGILIAWIWWVAISEERRPAH